MFGLTSQCVRVILFDSPISVCVVESFEGCFPLSPSAGTPYLVPPGYAVAELRIPGLRFSWRLHRLDPRGRTVFCKSQQRILGCVGKLKGTVIFQGAPVQRTT